MNTEVGTLYLVGTPIGNLEDVTLRALRVLAEVDVIAAEDTRVTRRLLEHHRIQTPLLSYHQHSGEKKLGRLLDMLRGGRQVALVCDAGMPGISDPGARLVLACAEAGVPTQVVPGPTAVSAALTISGLAPKEFLFLGFLPSRPAARRKTLRGISDHLAPIVCFEAPHRLCESLEDIREVLGDREVVCARELTKRFEEVIRGRVSELVAHFSARRPRGEMTLVLAGAQQSAQRMDITGAVKEVNDLVDAGLSVSRAVAHVAGHRGVSRGRLYRSALQQQRDGT